MSDTISTPCVTCKWAKWYAHDNRYGECGHPTAVQMVNAPICLTASAPAASISRQTFFHGSTPECRAHEPQESP